MKLSVHRGIRFLIPTSIITLIFVIGVLSTRQPSVSAGSPPPDVPDFEGEPFTAVFGDSAEIPQEIIEITAIMNGWTTVFDSNFESVNWEVEWLNLSLNGEPYKYGTRAIDNILDPTSTMVAWAVGGGPSGSLLDPNVDGYPPNIDAWLITGPFDFSDAIDARLTFEYYFDADVGDTLAIGASTDGKNFVGTEHNGGTGSWSASGMDLTSYAGQPQVWVAFGFTSDASGNPNKLGVLLDNVKLSVQYTNKQHMPMVVAGATPTTAPTATPEPGGDYLDEFTSDIVPWEARRWTNGATYNLSHYSSCDGSHCGLLNLLVNEKNKYVLVSPLVESRPYPYNIEIKAKVRSPREDQDQYSIIFGGNWNGQQCPAADFSSCFTNYYELRVRYREDSDRKWMEFKLKQIDGHDSSNQNFGEDLIKWTDVDEYVDEDSWVEWDVNVNSDGKIRIAADDNSVGSVTDTSYLNNPYFGLMVRNGDHEGSEVGFDYFKITGE